MVERSLALATALAPILGYDRAAEVAREAYRSGRTVREVAEEWNILSSEELDQVLDPRRMTAPGLIRDLPGSDDAVSRAEPDIDE
jgi:fumarate hydratase class II